MAGGKPHMSNPRAKAAARQRQQVVARAERQAAKRARKQRPPDWDTLEDVQAALAMMCTCGGIGAGHARDCPLTGGIHDDLEAEGWTQVDREDQA